MAKKKQDEDTPHTFGDLIRDTIGEDGVTKRKRGRPAKTDTDMRDRLQSEILSREPHSVVELPYGYKIECFTKEDEDGVRRDLEPYTRREDSIPRDKWAHIQRLLQTMMMWRSVTSSVSRMQSVPKAADSDRLAELIKWQTTLNRQIQEISSKFGLSLEDDGGDDSPAAIFDRYKAEAVRYRSEHRGEFEWQCPHCYRFCINEVPHSSYDLAPGPNVIWNSEVAALVARHYEWMDRWNRMLKSCTDNTRRVLTSGPVVEMINSISGLSVLDAAAVLRISPIGFLAAAWQKSYDLNITFNLDKPESLVPYVLNEHERLSWDKKIEDEKRIKAQIAAQNTAVRAREGEFGTDDEQHGEPLEDTGL